MLLEILAGLAGGTAGAFLVRSFREQARIDRMVRDRGRRTIWRSRKQSYDSAMMLRNGSLRDPWNAVALDLQRAFDAMDEEMVAKGFEIEELPDRERGVALIRRLGEIARARDGNDVVGGKDAA